MRRRSRKITTLSSAINEALKGLGLYKKYQQHRVWEVWDEVVGGRIASVAQPDRLDFDTLFVAVSDSIWLQQLSYLQQEVLEKLNRALGRKVINRIYFRLGNPKRMGLPRWAGPQKPFLPELGPKEIEAIDDTLNKLKDEESRALLRSIMVKSAALAKESDKNPEPGK